MQSQCLTLHEKMKIMQKKIKLAEYFSDSLIFSDEGTII